MNAWNIWQGYQLVQTVTDPGLGYGVAGLFIHIFRLIGGVG